MINEMCIDGRSAMEFCAGQARQDDRSQEGQIVSKWNIDREFIRFALLVELVVC